MPVAPVEPGHWIGQRLVVSDHGSLLRIGNQIPGYLDEEFRSRQSFLDTQNLLHKEHFVAERSDHGVPLHPYHFPGSWCDQQVWLQMVKYQLQRLILVSKCTLGKEMGLGAISGIHRAS